MSDKPKIEASKAVEDAIAQLIGQMPDEFVLVDEEGKPFEDSSDDVIALSDDTKFNIALLMLSTGGDFETTIRDLLSFAVEDGLDNDEEE